MTRRTFTIEDALRSDRLLGAGLGPIESWATWLAVLKGAYGLPLTPGELSEFKAVTGGREPPGKRVDELWTVIGRRGGKSKVAAAIAVFEATCVDHSAKLSHGETGHVLVLASTLAQAKVVFGYIRGYIEASPLVSQLLEPKGILSDEIRLNNGITVSVHPSSFRSVRGRTLVCAVLDEVSFWRSDDSANPDTETYRAILPSLATTDGLLVGISSPYRKIGLLYQKHRDYFGVADEDVLVAQGPSVAFNPTINKRVIDRDTKADAEAARAEWGGEFRSDLSSLLDDELIEAAIDHGRPPELPRQSGVTYHCFVDPSGGAHDAFCVGIAHKGQDDVIVLDALRGVVAPCDPDVVAKDFAAFAKSYGCTRIVGDRYAGNWVSKAFEKNSIRYEIAEATKSEIYLECVPQFARHGVCLPNHDRLVRELRMMERRTGRSGKDAVDHPRNGSDDFANAACGAIDLCQRVKKLGVCRTGFFLDGCAGPICWEDASRQPSAAYHIEGF